MKLTGNIH